MSTKGKSWNSREGRAALSRVRRIKRELADWPMSESRRIEKERELHVLRAQFNL